MLLYNSYMKYLLITVGILIGVGLLGAAYYFGTKQTTTKPVSPEAPITQSPAPDGTVVPPILKSSDDPNVKVFTSTDLKISFQYQEMQNDEKFATKQTGNKVYVYQAKFPVDQGQYVEVFSKDKADDLKTAIEKKFLANYSKNDCFAEIVKNPVAGQTLPASYVMAQISYPPSDSDTGPFWENADKCPSSYTTTNGIAYFLMDTVHPETFVFFSIGQYAINAGPSLPWQSTIKFL